MAESDGEDGDGRREGPVEGTGDVSVSWAERVVMLVALGFTAALFSFAVWQALTGATAALGSPSPGQLTVAFRYAPEGIFSNVTDRDGEGHSMSTVAETSPASPSLWSVTM